MFWNIINLVSFMINLLEWLVIYLCLVNVLGHILVILDKKHLTEQSSICFCRKSSNRIACLHPVRIDSTKHPTLCWLCLQSVCSCCFNVVCNCCFQTSRTKLEWIYHFGLFWPVQYRWESLQRSLVLEELILFNMRLLLNTREGKSKQKTISMTIQGMLPN